MKKLLMLALLFTGLTAAAQDGRLQTMAERENISSEQRLQNQLNTYRMELGLDDKQTEAVKQILAERNSRLEAKKSNMRQDLTPQEKEKMRSEMNAGTEMEMAELKKVLTPEQIAKWEKRKVERAAKVKAGHAQSQSE